MSTNLLGNLFSSTTQFLSPTIQPHPAEKQRSQIPALLKEERLAAVEKTLSRRISKPQENFVQVSKEEPYDFTSAGKKFHLKQILYPSGAINSESQKDFIAGLLYEFLIYDRAPKQGLVVADKELFVRSEWFENAVALANCPKRDRLEVEGAEKVLVACMILGERDAHDENLMVQTRGDQQVLVKIDHGYSLNKTEEDAKVNFFQTNPYIDWEIMPLRFDELHQELDRMICLLEGDRIDDLIDSAIHEMKRNGCDVSSRAQEYKSNVKYNLEIVKRLAKRASLVAQFPDEHKEKWRDFLNRSKDPLEYAIQNGIFIDGKDPIRWAYDNNAYAIGEISAYPRDVQGYRKNASQKWDPATLQTTQIITEKHRSLEYLASNGAVATQAKIQQFVQGTAPLVIEQYNLKLDNLEPGSQTALLSLAARECYKDTTGRLPRFEELKALSSEHIIALTAHNARMCYLDPTGRLPTFKDLKDLPPGQIRALTAQNARKCYANISSKTPKFKDLSLLSPEQIGAFTSFSAQACYADTTGKLPKLEDLIHFDTEKVKALTSWAARNCYLCTTGELPSFNDLKHLSSEQIVVHTQTLHGDWIYYLHISKEKGFPNFNDLKTFDAKKIQALTSENAFKCYRDRKGKLPKFEDLKDLSSECISVLISDKARDCYFIRSQKYPKFNDLKAFDARKIQALISTDAINCYCNSSFPTFVDLMSLDAEQIEVLTSENACSDW